MCLTAAAEPTAQCTTTLVYLVWFAKITNGTIGDMPNDCSRGCSLMRYEFYMLSVVCQDYELHNW